MSKSGKMLREYLTNREFKLSDEAVHLLFSANRWEDKEQLLETLNQGVTIICDRYAYSGIAYSAAKGLQYDWCKGPDRGLLKPDLVFYMDIDPEKIAVREGYGQERYEKVEFQKKVKEVYDKIKTEHEDKGYWVNVNAQSRNIENIHEEIINMTANCINDEKVELSE
mmetsp:Transcript_43337/g.41741  ORF Transcript_43337/g.41741 Transcript_43337/m.41741 type:complete len:167 (+) Transcript_43337:161-661(+)|eukprot:CAMPEP_0170543912 /NCGR_PEP_ID=MMETSP0211-20121228/2871_1 /TAXON_ID=311385 /ORGANISM="Pseudokeronopsis sp., Strain OXSARD2" /LENGTH=166 /DNA_ID=CAMNT_0010847427 /DNA_START=175 /DNA_END=675 /DNA_ORIENTATION=-